MATKIDIADTDGEKVTLQVQYGDNKTGRLEIVPDLPIEALTPAEICRLEVHKFSEALEEWCRDPGGTIGVLIP